MIGEYCQANPYRNIEEMRAGKLNKMRANKNDEKLKRKKLSKPREIKLKKLQANKKKLQEIQLHIFPISKLTLKIFQNH